VRSPAAVGLLEGDVPDAEGLVVGGVVPACGDVTVGEVVVPVVPVPRVRRRNAVGSPRRHATFWVAPERRNRVWQSDFTELETAAHGTWRITPVVDYFSKLGASA
jgi:hypothetical protein